MLCNCASLLASFRHSLHFLRNTLLNYLQKSYSFQNSVVLVKMYHVIVLAKLFLALQIPEFYFLNEILKYQILESNSHPFSANRIVVESKPVTLIHLRKIFKFHFLSQAVKRFFSNRIGIESKLIEFFLSLKIVSISVSWVKS